MAHHPHDDNAYWHSTLRLSAVLLGLWLLVTLGVCFYGPSLRFNFFGWPFGFWATAQGALLVFCAIVWVYALAMDRLEEAHGRPGGD
jgi:putative solute:sodium symporter small subunit